MNTTELNKTFNKLENIRRGLPCDWDEISDNFDWYMEANYHNTALFELSDKEQEKIFNDLRKISKGEDTI